MTDPNGGNGNKAMIKVHAVEIEHLTEAIKAQTELLHTYFGPNGICPKERADQAAFKASVLAHLKGLWAVVCFMIATLVTVTVRLLLKA